MESEAPVKLIWGADGDLVSLHVIKGVSNRHSQGMNLSFDKRRSLDVQLGFEVTKRRG
jgi:hypothetical protein